MYGVRMIAKPRKGYRFAVSVRRAAELTKALRAYEYRGRQLSFAISFANPQGLKPVRMPLVALDSPHDVTVFSVPETLDPEAAGSAAEGALALCSELSRSWKAQRGHTRRSYVVALEAPSTLIVIERLVRYRPVKYRGSQKFSHACKPQVVRIDYAELRRVPLETT